MARRPEPAWARLGAVLGVGSAFAIIYLSWGTNDPFAAALAVVALIAIFALRGGGEGDGLHEFVFGPAHGIDLVHIGGYSAERLVEVLGPETETGAEPIGRGTMGASWMVEEKKRTRAYFRCDAGAFMAAVDDVGGGQYEVDPRQCREHEHQIVEK